MSDAPRLVKLILGLMNLHDAWLQHADILMCLHVTFSHTFRAGRRKVQVRDEVLDVWELHAGILGFQSKSKAEGFYVSQHATKDLLT